MNIIRKNTVVIELEGQQQIETFKSIIEKCSSKGSKIIELMKGSKEKFTPDEKVLISYINDSLENSIA